MVQGEMMKRREPYNFVNEELPMDRLPPGKTNSTCGQRECWSTRQDLKRRIISLTEKAERQEQGLLRHEQRKVGIGSIICQKGRDAKLLNVWGGNPK